MVLLNVMSETNPSGLRIRVFSKFVVMVGQTKSSTFLRQQGKTIDLWTRKTSIDIAVEQGPAY